VKATISSFFFPTFN